MFLFFFFLWLETIKVHAAFRFPDFRKLTRIEKKRYTSLVPGLVLIVQPMRILPSCTSSPGVRISSGMLDSSCGVEKLRLSISSYHC